MSSFRTYVSPWSKGSYSSSPSSYLRSSYTPSSTEDKSSSSTAGDSYSRSLSRGTRDRNDGGTEVAKGSSGSGSTYSTTSGYRSLGSGSSSLSTRSPSAIRTSYQSPYSTSSSIGSSVRDRSTSRDRLGSYPSSSTTRARASSPEKEDTPASRTSSTPGSSSSLAGSYTKPSSLRPLSLTSRAGTFRSRYRDEGDVSQASTSPSSLGTRSPRADLSPSSPFKWTGRYTGSSLRSPGSEIPSTVFGVSGMQDDSRATAVASERTEKEADEKDADHKPETKEDEIITIVNRGTSPSIPSGYIRTRRYECAREIEKQIVKPKKKESVDAETQTDKGEEDDGGHVSRYSRFSSSSSSSSSRISSSPWSSYLDRYSSSSYVPRNYSRYGSSSLTSSNPSPVASRRTSPSRSSSCTSSSTLGIGDVDSSPIASAPGSSSLSTSVASGDTNKLKTIRMSSLSSEGSKSSPVKSNSTSSDERISQSPKTSSTYLNNSSSTSSKPKESLKETNEIPSKTQTKSSLKDSIAPSDDYLRSTLSPSASRSEDQSSNSALTGSSKVFAAKDAHKTSLKTNLDSSEDSKNGPAKSTQLFPKPQSISSDSSRVSPVLKSTSLELKKSASLSDGKDVNHSENDPLISKEKSDDTPYLVTTNIYRTAVTVTPGVMGSGRNTVASPSSVGRERSPSAGISSRPSSVPGSTTNSRSGSLERAEDSSSSRTSAGVKSLQSSLQDSCASSSKKMTINPLSTSRPPLHPNLQRSSSAASLNVANKDFRKSVLNIAEEKSNASLDLSEGQNKRQLRRKTRSRTLSGSDKDGSRDMLSGSSAQNSSEGIDQLPSSYGKSSPKEANASLESPAASDDEDNATSADSVDEDDEIGHGITTTSDNACKPPIPRKSVSEETNRSSPSQGTKTLRVRRRGETTVGPKSESISASPEPRSRTMSSTGLRAVEEDTTMGNRPLSLSGSSESPRTRMLKLKRVESGEKSWWMEGSTEPVPEGVIVRNDSDSNVSGKLSAQNTKSNSLSESFDNAKLFNLRRIESGDKAWWMEGSKEPVPEGVIVRVESSDNIASQADNSANRSDKNSSSPEVNDPNKEKKAQNKIATGQAEKTESSKASSLSEESGSGKEKLRVRKIKREPSGELAWWMKGSKEPAPEGIVRAESSHSLTGSAENIESSKTSSLSEEPGSGKEKLKVRKIKRDPSGELAWWMKGSDEPVPEGIALMESSHSLASVPESSEDPNKKEPSKSTPVRKKTTKKIIRRPKGETSASSDGSRSSEGLSKEEGKYSPKSSRSSNDEVNSKNDSISISDEKISKQLYPVDTKEQLTNEEENTAPGSRSDVSQSASSQEDHSKKSSISSPCKDERASPTRPPSGEGTRRTQEKKPMNTLTPPEDSPTKKGTKLIPLWKQASGERAWWMDEDAQVPEGIVKIESSHDIVSSHGDSERSTASRAESEKEVSNKVSSADSNDDLPRRRRLRKIETGEKAWWMENDAVVPEGITKIESNHSLASGQAAEAILAAKKDGAKTKDASSSSSSSESSSTSDSSSEDEDKLQEGSSSEEGLKESSNLGVRTSPDGIAEAEEGSAERLAEGEEGEEEEEEEEGEETRLERARRNLRFFIGRHTNIDDLLGRELALTPTGDTNVAAMVAAVEASQRSDAGRGVQIGSRLVMDSEEEDDQSSSSPVEEVDPSQVRIHDSTAQTPTLLSQQTATADSSGNASRERCSSASTQLKLDDAALQVYKDGDYGAYLDLEASISEQPEEFEGLQSNRKNSIVLRTQLSVRVHAVIEKLLNSEGRDLRRALFSLKQIFQEDKDLVHEFVQNEGLSCLIKVGSEADQNYQNYILRALGQVMLYVDGMNGVMAHNQTVQWLYSLIASKFRLVVKTALKLLLVFAEYVETNCLLLIQAVQIVDAAENLPPWSNVMKLLKDYDTADTELLIYATSLINRTLNGIPDQDTYYDQVDALEEQGMEAVVQRYMSKQGTDLDLLRQFQIYEAVLHHEDGEEKASPLKQLDETIRKTLRNRKSLADSSERRKSRRHSTGTSPMSQTVVRQRNGHHLRLKPLHGGHGEQHGGESSSSGGSPSPTETPTSPMHPFANGASNKGSDNVGVTPALRRRRERAERQRSFIREQQESGATLRASLGGQTEDRRTEEGTTATTNGHHEDLDSERAAVLRLRRENTVKDLTQKLASQGGLLTSPTEERIQRDIGDMSGIVSKAKEGLARSKSKADLRSPSDSSSASQRPTELKKSETELHWEELLSNSKRPLTLCDLDFTDLRDEDDTDILSPALPMHGCPPPPPPPCIFTPPPAPRVPPAPPPVAFGRPPPPPPLGSHRSAFSASTTPPALPATASSKKSKKTVKLFWKEVREDPVVLSKLSGGGPQGSAAGGAMIWDELQPVTIDTQKLEHLFESRAKDLIGKKQQELNKSKEIIVLDPKRSNAINIGMTKLPPPRSIKTAILKMDSTIVNREGIEKLLTMLPTEEERSRIQEAQSANPDVPLGSAEQFLLTLASISELSARLKLWAFKLDYENSEKEVAEPLMDLKQGMETLRASKTFRSILGTLLSVGIFLNGNEVKGFQIEYLAKVPEVKDTVHKHSLLHHLCHMVMEKFPDSSDLYSEIGAITRASKVDFDELATSIQRMEQECKASWDHLKVIAKHDGSTMVKVKMSDFLADCAERIIVLGIVHRRVMNRFNKFLLWLGIPMHRVQDTKPNEFSKIISEFSLEYRTTRERVLQQLEKKASHRERNKTRGKMITEVGKFRTKEDRADAELRQLLGNDLSEADSFRGTLPWRRQRKDMGNAKDRGLTSLLRGGNATECQGDNMTDGEEELLDCLVKTATKTPSTRTTPRERKRTRHADRKSLKRSRTRENNVFQFLTEACND